MFGSGWKGKTGAVLAGVGKLVESFGWLPEGMGDTIFGLGAAFGLFGIRDAQGRK